MVRLLKVWLNSVTTTSKGLNKLCCKQVSLEVRCTVEVREKYWKTKYRPVGVLLTCSLFLNSADSSKKGRATSCIQ